MLYKQIGKIEMEDKNMVKVIRVYGECLGALTYFCLPYKNPGG
nr:hypothetical protein [Borreliella garinii]